MEHDLLRKMGSFAKDIHFSQKHVCFLTEKKKTTFSWFFFFFANFKIQFHYRKNTLMFATTKKNKIIVSPIYHPSFICFTPLHNSSLTSRTLQPRPWELYPSTARGLWNAHLPSRDAAVQSSLSSFSPCKGELHITSISPCAETHCTCSLIKEDLFSPLSNAIKRRKYLVLNQQYSTIIFYSMSVLTDMNVLFRGCLKFLYVKWLRKFTLSCILFHFLFKTFMLKPFQILCPDTSSLYTEIKRYKLSGKFLPVSQPV